MRAQHSPAVASCGVSCFHMVSFFPTAPSFQGGFTRRFGSIPGLGMPGRMFPGPLVADVFAAEAVARRFLASAGPDSRVRKKARASAQAGMGILGFSLVTFSDILLISPTGQNCLG